MYLSPGLAINHLQAGFQVLIYMKTIDQVFKTILEQYLQNTMVSIQMPVSAAYDAKLANAEQ